MDKLYCYYLYSPTASYGLPPRFMGGNELPKQGFASLYAVTKADAKAIHTSGTAAGFKGSVYSSWLWIDVDSYEQAELVEQRIKSMGYGYISYDSGGRGAHFSILRNTEPSHRLPSLDKAWVKEHFPEADLSIYTHLHPFRISGSVHERTGRRKEIVSSGEGKALIIPNTIEEKNDVRNVRVGDFSGGGGRDCSIFSLGRIRANTQAFTAGERHHGLVRLAYALRDDAGASKELAFWYLSEVDKLCEEPKGEEGVLAAMRSIFE